MALTWAFGTKVARSSEKLLLVCMANHADENGICFPSWPALIEQTMLNRKTVMVSMRGLVGAGLVVDTGQRRGTTRQVIVYKLVLKRTCSDAPDAMSGPITDAPGADKTGPEMDLLPSRGNPLIGPETDLLGAPQKEETGPILPPNRSNFTTKQVQFYPLTGPKTDLGTLRNPQGTIREPSESVRARARPPPTQPRARRLPDDWVPSDADRSFAAGLGLSPDAVADRFRDWWRGAPGQKGVKLDWAATWRNWCRTQAERGNVIPTAGTRRGPAQRPKSAAEQWAERFGAGAVPPEFDLEGIAE